MVLLTRDSEMGVRRMGLIQTIRGAKPVIRAKSA